MDLQSKRPSFEEQGSIIRDINANFKLVVGEKAYLIEKKWHQKWKYNTNYNQTRPPVKYLPLGQIDNSPLIINGDFNEVLTEDFDFVTLVRQEWEKLYSWYGANYTIPRDIILNPRTNEPFVVIKNIRFKISYLSNCHRFVFNNFNTLEDVRNEAINYFKILEKDKVILYDMLRDKMPKRIKKLDSMLKETNLINDQDIKIEIRNDRPFGDRYAPAEDIDDDMFKDEETTFYHPYLKSEPLGPGKVGLINLGNTCYFNSGVQCIVHQMPLVSYFLHHDWKADLNETNPLGLKGELARELASYIKRIWKGAEHSISPSSLKNAIGRFARQFIGFNQQDSHELITFMLDGVHEDLNKCREKINLPPVTGNGIDDLETARKTWSAYKKRNDSIVVDTFHGLLRSRLICPTCHSTCTVFDPYVAISLPLASQQVYKIKIIFIPYEYTQAYQQFEFEVKKNSEVEHIRKLISNKIGKEVKIAIGRIRQMNKVIMWGIEFGDNYWDYGNYYAYEIRDTEKFYTQCLIQTKWVTTYSSLIDRIVAGPFLIELPNANISLNQIGKLCEEKFKSFWKKDDTISISVQGASILKNMHFPIPENSVSGSQRFRCSFMQKPSLFAWERGETSITPDKNYPYVSSNMIIVEINPFFATDEYNFNVEAILRHSDEGEFKESTIIPNNQINLDTCFEFFSSNEILDPSNQWFCPKCREHVCADKKMNIWSCPKCLIIHLKRFVANKNKSSKITKTVEYPDILDMNKYIIGPQKAFQNKYRLTAISEHMGTTSGGHYTAKAIVKGPKKSSQWYSFDDSMVRETTAKEVHNDAAYVLFYERMIDTEATSIPNLPN